MSIHDLWEGLTAKEIAAKRARNAPRWQRRWREGQGRDAKQRKRSYRDHQKPQALQDEAAQMGVPGAVRIARESVTVGTLLDRHLAARADRAPKTVETDKHHAQAVRDEFGSRTVTTITPTDIETWTAREGLARSSRKKQLEMLRAAIKRGIRDSIVDADPTEGIIVTLGQPRIEHLSAEQLMAVGGAAPTRADRLLILVMGLMGLRSGEARALKVGDLADGRLRVRDSGGGTGGTKTKAGRRALPVPAILREDLAEHARGRPKSAPMFPSPRRPGEAIAERYPGDALTRAITHANRGRSEPIPRITVHGLRHTFAAIALSEAGADLLAVSRAMGHARPSITLDRYGHLSPAGLDPLMARIDEVVQGAPGRTPKKTRRKSA